MKYLALLVGFLLIGFSGFAQQPCSTTNAAGCGCRDGSASCELLPDITISWDAALNYAGGPEEFSQTGNGSDNGRLRITGSTPNVGYGAFTVRGSNWFVCGADTFQYTAGTPPLCPDGVAPRQLLHQRIYRKNGARMTFRDRFAGAMTFHPSHGHNHVDDWSVFTLRLRDTTQRDPRQWPIVGTGAKVGFCLMDFYSCTDGNAQGHCRTNNTVYQQGASLVSTSSFRNYGLGGGQYNCSPVEQGISAGWTDVYSKNLDGMWINLPADLCNGEYWIVLEVDPRNYFQEENETNNYTAVPFTLRRQTPAGTGTARITLNGSRAICPGETVELTASIGWRYRWSTGDTTRTIRVGAAGSYAVTVDSYCGSPTSAPIVLTLAGPPPPPPTATASDTVCAGSPATLTATGSATLQWFDAAGALVGAGPSFTTPALLSSATYFVKNIVIAVDTAHAAPVDNTLGSGDFANVTQGLVFNADVPFTLASCVVYAELAGARTIELRNDYGLTIATRTVSVPAGAHRIVLDLPVPAGRGWRLVGIPRPGAPMNFYRNATGIQYPYTLPGVLSIIGSTIPALQGYYFYFYDWKVVTTQSACGGAAVPVAAVVANTPATIGTLQNAYPLDGAPVTLVGSPAGGMFSGPGVVGGLFYPSVAGLGGPFTLTYTYRNARGCTTTATATTRVNPPVGMTDDAATDGLRVAPNPAHDHFRVDLTLAETQRGELALLDLLGRTVVRRPLASAATHHVDVAVAGLPAGPYLLKVVIGGRCYVRRLVVE
ncbi:MAG: T9SS type A sorting domain-containing protein [Hymenobacteraceae bacterium]|nr:T9SS type A sorting domain-containing protein [Hymenobacteraceae bacterium]